MESVAAAARAVLLTAAPVAKALAARRIAREWRAGRLAWSFDIAMPDRPARPDTPLLLAPSRMPKRGRAGSRRSRVAMLHAVAHIEFNAIDLACDIAGRFGGGMPRGFTDDWLRIAAEEAGHFAAVRRRLAAAGARYGDLPAHDGLWEAATATRGDLLARLAIVPMVLEARGLDVTPGMIARFAAAGDTSTVHVLHRIMTDEINHVAAGTSWFRHVCASRRVVPEKTWRDMVTDRFAGAIRPPFNASARDAAGLPRELYLPLAGSGEVEH